MEFESHTILITSNEPWGDMWFSKQHYAYELSKLGHQIYFINPTNKWNWHNIFSFNVKFRDSDYENLTIVCYKNNFPQSIFKPFFTLLNDFLNCIKLNRYININDKNVVWWKFDPYRFLTSFPYNKSKHIYHVVDPYINLWQDKYHAKSAELIVCCNQKFYNSYFSKYENNKVIYIPHGVSEDEFDLNEDKVNLIKEKHGNYALMTGTISDQINFKLLKKIIEKSTIKVLIIGKKVKLDEKNELKWEEIVTHSNLKYIPLVNGKELKNWILASQFCIVVYNFNLQHQSSLKILNYLIQNKIIISSLTGEFSSILNKAIYYAENEKQYIELYKKAINNELLMVEKEVIKILNQRTYKNLIGTIFEELKN